MNTVWNLFKNKLEMHSNSRISDDENNISFKETLCIAEENAEKLSKLLNRRSKCAILCERGLNTANYILACWSANMIPIVLSKNYGNKHCMNIIKLTQPNLIMTDNINMNIFKDIDFPVYSMNDNKLLGNIKCIKYEDELDDVAIIMCTSGTSGVPKGAMITEKGLLTNVEDIGKYFKIDSTDKLLIVRPLYHCAVLTGEFLVSVYKGINLHFYDGIYNPASVLEHIGNNNITVLCGTPTLFSHLVLYAKRSSYNLNLKAIGISGECLSAETAKKIRSALANTDIYNIYGLTEASPRVSYLHPKLFDKYPESVGLPIASVKVRIVDDNGKDVSINTDGHLIVKGPNVMKGYYRNSETNALNGEWLNTGDIAYQNEEELLFIRSRADDMIIKGGMNIYPKEIEDVLIQQGMIDDVIAYGIKSNSGMDIGLNIVLNEKYSNLKEREIMDICSKSLPHYQIPSQINIVDEIKRNASGKKVKPKSII